MNTFNKMVECVRATQVLAFSNNVVTGSFNLIPFLTNDAFVSEGYKLNINHRKDPTISRRILETHFLINDATLALQDNFTQSTEFLNKKYSVQTKSFLKNFKKGYSHLEKNAKHFMNFDDFLLIKNQKQDD